VTKHRFTSQFTLLGVLAGAVTGLLAEPAEACGGFFCSQQQPVNQAAERIIFANNGDGTITAVIQIMYEGPSENFSWLLPISTVPEEGDLGLASDVAFQRLQAATNPQFNLNTRVEGTCRNQFADRADGEQAVLRPADPCGGNSLLVDCEGPGSVNLAASGVVGAFEWSAISVDAAVADPADAALQWLTQYGYDVTPESARLLGPYLADGMHLLALRLTKGADTGSIRPIKLTYAADAPMIPIKLTAVAANEDMGVMTWALSSSRAVPLNYHALELNEARINWFNAASNYGQVVNEAADDAGGQGFVTEFAGPSSQLADVVWQSGEEADWQSVKNGTYRAFDQIFDATYSRYSGWSGFWDAVRKSVTLEEGLAFEDFKACPGCYMDQVSFSPTAFLAAIEAEVIEPMRGVQELIDRAPYTTRLYSTLSAAEMTADPVFVFNPDMPDVSNVHQADRVVECDGSVFEFEAPWRIDFPQGTVIRGTPDDVGSWPTEVDQQPANFRVSTLAAAGDGRVVDDNAETITGMLATYNATIPGPAMGPDGVMRSSGGACALTVGPGEGRPAAALLLGLWGLLGAAWLRRRQR
jgi:hypothetical protein